MHKHNSLPATKDLEPKRPNYLIRRFGVLVTALTLGVGATLGIKEGIEFVKDRNVNVEVPSDVLRNIDGRNLSDKELREEFGVERIIVKKDENLGKISDDYIEKYELRLDTYDVEQILREQNGGTDTVRPEDEFYLPVHENR